MKWKLCLFKKKQFLRAMLSYITKPYLLERESPFYLDTKFLGYKHLKEWFEDYIKSLLERPEDKEPQIISLEDLIPVEVYRRVLQNPKTKFRFRIVVEAQEIKTEIGEAYG